MGPWRGTFSLPRTSTEAKKIDRIEWKKTWKDMVVDVMEVRAL